jgi:putative NADH-flavin reductase
MRIVIFGVTGNAGSRIASEALRRGHAVVGVVREPGKAPIEGVEMRQGDVLDAASVAEVARGADVVISAVGPGNFERSPFLANAAKALIAGLKEAGVKRLLVVGGAGGLEAAPGLQLVDTPGFPEAWKGIALSHRDAWHVFAEGPDLDWTYVAPAAMFEPGERTGKYRTGTNELIGDAHGSSRISMEDYAIALMDEVEKPAHVRSRMSVGY